MTSGISADKLGTETHASVPLSTLDSGVRCKAFNQKKFSVTFALLFIFGFSAQLRRTITEYLL